MPAGYTGASLRRILPPLLTASVSPQTETQPRREPESDRPNWLLVGILGLALALRFATLGLQSYWSDEAVTVGLVRGSFAHMLSALPGSERTPPVYYMVAWVWARVFGTSEAGLRSLSALVGTLTVLMAYLIARRLAGARAGVVAAGLTAVSPILVWYSQEARSYELLVFLCAASVWLWMRAMERPLPRRLISWGAVACLAIATHYFASFIVIFEVVALLRSEARTRVLWAVLAVLAVVQLALLPLAVHQAHAHEGPGDYITATSLSSRILAVPKRFLLGEHGAPGATAAFALSLLALLGFATWLFARRLEPETRRRTMPLLWLAVTALAAPLALALAGLDFFAYRNLLAVWVLLAVVAAAALGTRTRQGGALAACGLGVIFLALTISVNLTPSLQRADWRYSPTALGQPPWPRLIVITPNFEADPFRIYDPSAQFSTVRRVAVREIDLVGYRIPPRGHPPRLGHGFRLADRVDHQRLSFVRYIAPRTTSLDLRSIRGLTREPRSWLLEPAS